MGDGRGQALSRFLPAHGQVPLQPGEGAGHLVGFEQGGKLSRVYMVDNARDAYVTHRFDDSLSLSLCVTEQRPSAGHHPSHSSGVGGETTGCRQRVKRGETKVGPEEGVCVLHFFFFFTI